MESETKTKANVKEAVPFFSVSNMEESLRFYVDGLGFEMTGKWVDDGKIRWCKIEHGGAGLMLQEFRTEGHDSWVPEGKVGEGVSIYFMCEDALEIYRDIRSRGIETSKPTVSNGCWHTCLSDPDGYRIHFESDTDEPEDSEYAG